MNVRLISAANPLFARFWMDVRAVDLFCGAGGLTRGLLDAGIDVRFGVDTDPDCRYPYEANNDVPFVLADVATLKSSAIRAAFRGADVSVLAGCAPCQAFSTNNVRRGSSSPHKHRLIRAFERLVDEVRPDIVTMENVPYLQTRMAFRDFIARVSRLKYHVWVSVADVRLYGVPQARKRLVVLASRIGPLELVPPSHKSEAEWITVREALGKLPALRAGQQDASDALHIASQLSETNLERLRASKPGGSWRSWPKKLRAKCHTKKQGARYVSVYGRMEWNKPSPTITTLCYGFGNGRFGHPSQLRGISLREAAILQSFPRDYEFVPADQRVRISTVGRLIGNAVPVRFAKAIGMSIKKSLETEQR